MHRDGGSQKTYAAMVQSLDANVGRVAQALDASDLASNTTSSSPATMAASVSPTFGHSPA